MSNKLSEVKSPAETTTPDFHNFTISSHSTLTDQNHYHYKEFLIHPGYTTLIACCIILLFLSIYLWHENLKMCFVTCQKFCCASPVKANDSEKENIKMIEFPFKEEGQSCQTSMKISRAVTETEQNTSSDNEITNPNGGHLKDYNNQESEESQGLAQKITTNWSISMSPINTLAHPHVPIILLTPATPLPMHHSSFEDIRRNSSSSDLLQA